MPRGVEAATSRQTAAKAKAVAPGPQPSTGLRPAPQPTEPLPFSLADIRAAIPKHCFERSVLTSFRYLAQDLAMVAGLVYAASWISAAPAWVAWVAWPMYWFAAGTVGTGLWVLAHECGHGAFTDSKDINDAVGMVLHSALLVPYHSWRISHSNHHANTCSCENDEVFVPASKPAAELNTSSDVESPLLTLAFVLNMLLLGWPGYLIANLSGPAKYANKRNSHFDPQAALFTAKQAGSVVASDLGFIAALVLLGVAVSQWGFMTVAAYYGVPYLVVNAYLVLITFLQHTDTYIPHYRESEFTWLRGALATVDRSMGPVIDTLIHHIGDTHVCHHVFHYLPFYHAQEATKAIKQAIGPYYLKDDTPTFVALWRAWRDCKHLPAEADIAFYQR